MRKIVCAFFFSYLSQINFISQTQILRDPEKIQRINLIFHLVCGTGLCKIILHPHFKDPNLTIFSRVALLFSTFSPFKISILCTTFNLSIISQLLLYQLCVLPVLLWSPLLFCHEIYLAWLLLALLPLWRCSNVHLWQSVLGFYLLLFLPLLTLYVNTWSLLFSLESLQLGPFCLGVGALGIQCFCTEGGCNKTVSKSSLTQWSLRGQAFTCACSPTDPARFPTGQPIWLELLGEQWPAWCMTPAAPPLRCLSTKLWIRVDVSVFHRPFVFWVHFLRLMAI